MLFQQWKNKLKKHLRRPFHAAYVAAIAGDGVGSGKFRHGAVIYHKNVLLSVGINSYKTHPKLIQQTEYPYLHAEQHALFRLGTDNTKGRTMYVIRIGRNCHILESRPCEVCQFFLNEAKLKNVYYSTYEGVQKLWDA